MNRELATETDVQRAHRLEADDGTNRSLPTTAATGAGDHESPVRRVLAPQATLAALATAWLCGVAVSAWLTPPVRVLAAGVIACVLALPAVRGRAWAYAAISLGACATLGAMRQAWADAPLGPSHIAHLNGGGAVAFRGRIEAEPERRDRRTGYYVAAESRLADDAWQPAHGLVLVWSPTFPVHGYGETVRVHGRLEDPPQLEGFDYQAYLARQGVHSVIQRGRMETLALGGGNPLRRVLVAAKDRARGGLADCLPEPEASLATGVVLGDDNGIPRHVAEAFRRTNTSHIIAISGSNVSLLVLVLMISFGRLIGARRAVPVVLCVLAVYAALVGADAAVVRAAIMGGLMVVAGYVGRRGDGVTALLTAAWAMTAYRPGYLWDLGFQLSFAATLGLLWYTERFGDRLRALLARGVPGSRARQLVRLVNEMVIVTLAAQLTTWPLIAHHVGQVSLIGLAANALILPAQPWVMSMGAMTAILGAVWPPAGRLAGSLAWLPLAYTIRVVESTADLPLAAIAWTMPMPLLAAYYALLGVAGVPSTRSQARSAVRLLLVVGRHCAQRLLEVGGGSARLRGPAAGAQDGDLMSPPLQATPPTQRGRRRGVVLGALTAACALAWVGALSRPDGLLHLFMLDVGQGDSLLVVAPNGRRMLVDGGPSPSAVLDGLGRLLPPWDRRLDLVVATHPDADHVGGLVAVLGRYRVGAVVDSGQAAETPDAEAWQAILDGYGGSVVRPVAGQRLVLDDEAGVLAEVLWPPDALPEGAEADVNDGSIVLRLTYGRTAMLLTGDIGSSVEAELLARSSMLTSDVLKVAHHGSASSSSAAFLAVVEPSVALIGVAAENRHGHPEPDIVARLSPALVRRTDRDGTVELLMDGRVVWLVR